MNYAQIKAIKKSNKQRLIKHFGNIPETSGIYFLTREENGFKYAYIGQAKNILQRMASHLVSYQHIDLSLKKHKLYSENNKTGWHLSFVELPIQKLDIAEQEFIKEYANKGYQLRNKTSGSQGKGKTKIADFKQPKTYTQGKEYGRKQQIEELNKYYKYLTVEIKDEFKHLKRAENALEKFKEILGGNNEV